MTREQCERELQRMIVCSELPPFDGPDRTRNEALRAAIDGWAEAERERDAARMACIGLSAEVDRLERLLAAARDTTGASREEG